MAYQVRATVKHKHGDEVHEIPIIRCPSGVVGASKATRKMMSTIKNPNVRSSRVFEVPMENFHEKQKRVRNHRT